MYELRHIKAQVYDLMHISTSQIALHVCGSIAFQLWINRGWPLFQQGRKDFMCEEIWGIIFLNAFEI